jgi:hypothetical protein
MRKILAFIGIIALVLFLLPQPSKAADEASFSATTDRTSYAVGDDVTVSFSVDAGTYASTLSVIDANIKISDTSVIEPKDKTTPFVAGTIFSSIPIQSYQNGVINIVAMINPDNKPSSRSGVIGTVAFKALKAGQATISYDRIEAAQEGSETDLINTSASSLVVTVGGGTSAVASSTATTGAGAVSVGTVSKTATATGATKAAAAATTGPADTLPAIILGGMIIFLIYNLLKIIKTSTSRL